MKIYFAGSIRGGRDDVSLYSELISYLGRFGDVLTEHVGCTRLERQGELNQSDASIFGRDIDWLTAADVVVAEVSTPSLGVGYEIGFAESLSKPILCLVRSVERESLSAMIAGNGHLRLAEYATVGEAKAQIDEFMKEDVRPQLDADSH
jgi:nucleoside 2-deoxyribosyltransferase